MSATRSATSPRSAAERPKLLRQVGRHLRPERFYFARVAGPRVLTEAYQSDFDAVHLVSAREVGNFFRVRGAELLFERRRDPRPPERGAPLGRRIREGVRNAVLRRDVGSYAGLNLQIVARKGGPARPLPQPEPPPRSVRRRMRLGVCLGWILPLLAACEPGAPGRVEAPPDAAAGTVPIEWAGPDRAALLVPVHVNGRGPYAFVLDTGATLTCVGSGLADELGLPETAGQVGIGVGIGHAGAIRLVRIDSLRVGAARAERLSACALDLSAAGQIGIEFDGLLGLNFLRSFHLSIDFERDEVTLR